MADNYMMNPTVKKYYEQWAKLPTFFSGHPADNERFHKFVRACVEYAKARQINTEELDIDILRLHLTDAFSSLGESTPNRQEEVSKFIIRFQDITWYEATKLE